MRVFRQVYPEGFKDISLTTREVERLAGVAAYMKMRQEERAYQYVNEPNMRTTKLQSRTEFYVSIKDEIFKVRLAPHTKADEYDVYVNDSKVLYSIL